MSKELRYLLHGNKEKYDDVQTPLFITSQESTLWQKIGLQVLTSRKEAWRLIDSVLVDSLPTANFQRLGIEKLLAEKVVDEIRPNPESVDGSLLNKSEIDELLRHISQYDANKDLWRSLKLHETVDGTLENIQAGRVYLKNPNFTLDPRIKDHVVLIRRNEKIRQDWIDLWTPDAAIAKVLSLPNPHQYYDIILDALEKMSPDEKKELHKESLKSSGWLPTNGYCPQDILKLPNNLEQYARKIASLDNSKHPQQVLHESVRKSKVEHWIKSLFTFWNAEIVIKKILTHDQKNIEHWQSFCPVILDALSTSISDELKTILTRESWLFLGDRTVSPSKIIIIPEKLQKHLSTLVDLSAGEYAEISQLPKEIKNHKNFPILNKFFSQWKENDVIEFILDQSEPHKYFEIILDALSSLLPQSTPNNVNTQKLSTLAWLVDKQGNAIDPKSIMILHYPSLNEEIEGLVYLVPDCYISSSQLAKQFRDHNDCWQWLTEKLFITEDKALTEIGKLLNQAPEYQLGEFSIEEFPLDKCLETFKDFNVSFLPAWNFANNLSQEKFKRYLLQNLLDKMEVAKLRDLLKLLSSPEPQVDAANAANVEIFNTYLGLAINYGTFSTDILPHIRLLNRKGQWKSPNELIKEGNNIDDTYVLDEKQLQIIHSFLQSETQGNQDLPESDEASEDENNILINYFKKWEDYCPLEPIGAFLSLFNSSDNKIKKQAEYYLGRRNIEHLRQRLLENEPKPIRVFKVHIGQAENRTCQVTSILGCTFDAELANLPNPPHFFVNEGELASNTTRLELLHIQPEKPAIRTELVRIIKDSTKVLLKKVYGVETNSIEAIWDDLRNSDQLDIRVAEKLVMKSASYILRELGIQELSVKMLLDNLEDLHRNETEYEVQNLNEKKQATEKEIQEKLSELSNLLKNNEGVKESLLESVREKIKQYGYRPQSIPFELFQNADDAVVEWQEMSSPTELEDERKEFVVVMSDRQLSFIHAGRPIGCFQHSDNPERDYRDEGYHRDLEKMLTFNNSDKGDGVTGMFGLGFKSVYLSSCKRPRILSKRLGFAVEGGLLPSRLSPEETKDLQEKLELYNMPSDATIVELELDQGIQPQEIIREFQERAGVLTVFSRAITKYRFINKIEDNDSKLFTWERKPFLGIQGVEINRITIKGEDSLRLCLRTASGSALLLDMTERDGRLSCTPPPPDAPTFWVTAPTQEKLSVGFILNAAFKVTTGRTRLDSTGQNKERANYIGIALGQLLKKLCEANWEDVKVALGFSSVDSYSFWEFLWKELAVSWQKLDTNERRDLISRILGGDRGMGYLITRSEALPNGLYGDYRKLIRINSNTKYSKVTGKLAEESCFCKVASWSSFQKSSDPRILIVDTQWEEATKLLDKSLFDKRTINIDDIQLLKALKTEVGVSEAKVTPEKAKEVGKLISKSFLNSFNNSSECDSMKNFLPQIKFQSKAGNYLPSEQLLSATSEQAEEKLLVGFAPDDRLLHVDYTDTAIEFFYACRLQRKSIPVEVLQEWVLWAETTEKRKAIYDYLSKGEHRDQLAKLLYENSQDSWIKKDQSINRLIESMMRFITERENEYQPEPTDSREKEDQLKPTGSIIQTDQQGVGDNAEKWGKVGEDAAKLFYEKLDYDVTKQPDKDGYDFKCVKRDSELFVEELFVEVKTINPTYNDMVRITKNEWRAMCEIPNSDKYELFIVCHSGDLITNRIRIKSAWKTLKEVFSKLDQQDHTNCKYTEDQEVLIALQRNENGLANDILFNWKKLAKTRFSENIEEVS